MRFAFISRHAPTDGQFALAYNQDVILVPIGDRDAFSVNVTDIMGHENGPFDGVVVVHPAAAMRLCGSFLIGVFENANRAPEGEKPSFEAVSFYVYDNRD
jgi:hypothetical protein